MVEFKIIDDNSIITALVRNVKLKHYVNHNNRYIVDISEELSNKYTYDIKVLFRKQLNNRYFCIGIQMKGESPWKILDGMRIWYSPCIQGTERILYCTFTVEEIKKVLENIQQIYESTSWYDVSSEPELHLFVTNSTKNRVLWG